MSYPDEVSIEPRKLVYVTVNVTVPSDYPGDVRLNPAMYATELGATGGATVINIQMKKIVALDIDANSNPQFRALKLATFMHQVSIGDEEIEIAIESSSSVTDFNFDMENKRLSLKVTGPDGTEGTTVIQIGRVLEGPYSVTFDGQSTAEFETITDQVTGETSIKLDYRHSTHDIVITGTNVVPEFPSVMIIAGAAVGTLVIMARKRLLMRP